MSRRSTVSVSNATAKLIQSRVDSGEFDSAEVYIHALIRQDRARQKARDLETRLLQRLDRSDAVEFDDRDRALIGRRIQKVLSTIRKKSA